MPHFNVKRIRVLILIIFVIIGIAIYTKTQPAKPQYNLLLISVDTLQPDHMGVYGYPKNTTPNIDKWAKNAFVFTKAYTTVPATYPSFVALMTGKAPYNLGINDNVLMTNNRGEIAQKLYIEPVDRDTQTLVKLLKRHNYNTAAFLANEQLDAKYTNLDIGFDEYKVNYKHDDKTENESFFANALEWLRQNREKRFFLWVHFIDPHTPYLPPEQLRCKFSSKHCKTLSRTSDKDLVKEQDKYAYRCVVNPPPNSTYEINQALYDAETMYTDGLVGKFLQNIKDFNLDKNTVVVFYSDHGESFDHNYFFAHSKVLYESSVKIPFIIKSPINKGGAFENDLIDNTNMLSLILRSLQGTSERKKDRKVYAINTDMEKLSVTDGRFKYIYSVGENCLYKSYKEELYDLKNDPKEEKNLVFSDILKRLSLKASLFMHFTPILVNQKIQLFLGYPNRAIVKIEEKPELQDLKSLGY